MSRDRLDINLGCGNFILSFFLGVIGVIAILSFIVFLFFAWLFS